MKKIILSFLACLLLQTSWAADLAISNSGKLGLNMPQLNVPVLNERVAIVRNTLGTGEQNRSGYEASAHLGDGVYHVPQYLPYHPTAATIWPRIVEVECERYITLKMCDGYHWLPEMGRGEYLFFVPVSKKISKPPAPVIIEKIIPSPERIILKEVEPKKKAQ